MNVYLHVAEWLLEGLAGFLADFFIKKHLGNNEARYQRYKVCFYFWVNMICGRFSSSSIMLLQIMVACTLWPCENVSCHHCYCRATLWSCHVWLINILAPGCLLILKVLTWHLKLNIKRLGFYLLYSVFLNLLICYNCLLINFKCFFSSLLYMLVEFHFLFDVLCSLFAK